jgi:hypothetical protein
MLCNPDLHHQQNQLNLRTTRINAVQPRSSPPAKSAQFAHNPHECCANQIFTTSKNSSIYAQPAGGCAVLKFTPAKMPQIKSPPAKMPHIFL